MKRTRAFSLLELSVVLVIISLIVAFGFSAGQNALQGADRVTTQTRLSLIQGALDNFAKQNGYLPCPAQRALLPSSASFGVESRSGTVCNVTGDIKSLTSTSPGIYLGGVPVRTLGLPDAYAADAWSDKFLYAVSLNHVGDAGAYANTDGAITVKFGDRSGTNYAITTTRSCTNAANCTAGAMATYVVLSHGPDGKGSYPLYGTSVVIPCGTSTNDDVANCDEANATASADNSYHAVFYNTLYNDAVAVPAKFFDDYVVWGSNALMRAPLTAPMNSCFGGLLSSGGSNTCVAAMPDCVASCLSAGYTSGSVTVNSCLSNSGCSSSGGLSCNYQCCCTGTPPSGCSPQTQSWIVSGNTCTGALTGTLANGASTTLINYTAGVAGTVTVTCNSGSLARSSPSCAAGNPALGCSGGNCQEWCAPCRNSGNGYPIICQRDILYSNPCQAHCVYAGCPGSGKPCATCP